MNSKELSFLKSKLLTARRELLEGVAKVQEHSNEEFKGDLPDLTDEASRTYNRQVMLSIGEVDRQQIKLVEEALERIESGSDGGYGVCIDCEEDIPYKRLEAAPYVKRCVECKEAWEESLKAEQ